MTSSSRFMFDAPDLLPGSNFHFISIFFSENVTAKFEQQKQKTDAEYSARCMAVQRTADLEQKLNSVEQRLEEMSRKYGAEMENVMFYFQKMMNQASNPNLYPQHPAPASLRHQAPLIVPPGFI